jgi:hypothetical protein
MFRKGSQKEKYLLLAGGVQAADWFKTKVCVANDQVLAARALAPARVTAVMTAAVRSEWQLDGPGFWVFIKRFSV